MSDFTSKFQPITFTPVQEALLELQKEMREKGAEIFALYLDSVGGYEFLTKHLEEWKKERIERLRATGIEVNADVWDDIADFPIDPPPHGKNTNFGEFARSLSDYETRNKEGGRNGLLIGNYLLIALYQFWDHTWRNRIAKITKAPLKTISSDFWGDLRLIRNRLLHDGVADEELQKKTKLLKWFKAGTEIWVDERMTKEIISAFFVFLYGELIDYEKLVTPVPQPTSN